jgi:hypothetical protein
MAHGFAMQPRSLVIVATLAACLLPGCGDERRYVEQIWEAGSGANRDGTGRPHAVVLYEQIVLYDTGEAAWLRTVAGRGHRTRLVRRYRWAADENGPYLLLDGERHYLAGLETTALSDGEPRAKVPFRCVYRLERPAARTGPTAAPATTASATTGPTDAGN